MLDYQPECWTDVQKVLDAGLDRMILFGPSGTGKTMAGLTMGNVAAGAFRLECTENMTDFEVVGGYIPGANGFEYKEGAGIKAWKGDGLTGGRLVVDEIDKASGDVYATLLAITDSHASASWQHPVTGQKIKPTEGFSVVMTTNLDDMSMLEPALRDRFPVAIRIDKPHPLAIAALPNRFQRYAVATVGEISIRSWQAIARLEQGVGLDEALRLVVGAEKAAQLADDVRIDEVA